MCCLLFSRQCLKDFHLAFSGVYFSRSASTRSRPSVIMVLMSRSFRKLPMLDFRDMLNEGLHSRLLFDFFRPFSPSAIRRLAEEFFLVMPVVVLQNKQNKVNTSYQSCKSSLLDTKSSTIPKFILRVLVLTEKINEDMFSTKSQELFVLSFRTMLHVPVFPQFLYLESNFNKKSNLL